jgi:hypothetical protein
MHEVSLVRLYLLRAMYLLVAVGLGMMIWPLLLGDPDQAEHFRGATWALLGALGLLALLGIRHPLAMLPLLLFELTWKVIWVLLIGLPLREAGGLVGEFRETWTNNLLGVVLLPLVIPWGYVIRRYVRAPGERWRASRAA